MVRQCELKPSPTTISKELIIQFALAHSRLPSGQWIPVGDRLRNGQRLQLAVDHQGAPWGPGQDLS